MAFSKGTKKAPAKRKPHEDLGLSKITQTFL
jgi:hypothetical protein